MKLLYFAWVRTNIGKAEEDWSRQDTSRRSRICSTGLPLSGRNTPPPSTAAT